MRRRLSNVVLSYPDRFRFVTTQLSSTERTMEHEDVGEIIASRQLYYIDDTNRKRIVNVFVGKPQPSPDNSDYRCLFQVIGIGQQKTQIARGNDSIQALQSALILAAANLNYLNDQLGRKLMWDGGPKGELGFP
ncbi:MAG TPA: hypothetical protein VE863_17360 [Pyrinomonadaceae bacterium]|nr:hypothetical protein [Pyrinomonadaceae bacterium]